MDGRTDGASSTDDTEQKSGLAGACEGGAVPQLQWLVVVPETITAPVAQVRIAIRLLGGSRLGHPARHSSSSTTRHGVIYRREGATQERGRPRGL